MDLLSPSRPTKAFARLLSGPPARQWEAYWRWLPEQSFALPHQQLAFEKLMKRILEAQARVERLEAGLTEAGAGWRFSPVVHRLQALRGIKLITATALVAELGDLTR